MFADRQFGTLRAFGKGRHASGPPTLASMQPKTLALVDDDLDYAEYLTQDLRERGIAVRRFDDSNALLADPEAFDFEFYLIDLMLPGVQGTELIKILRRRTEAGIVVVSGRLGPEVFGEVITAGADMYLVKPVQFEQVALAIGAVQRRVVRPGSADSLWKFDAAAGELIAPDGIRIQLSDADQLLIECFVKADGQPVTREALLAVIGPRGWRLGGRRRPLCHHLPPAPPHRARHAHARAPAKQVTRGLCLQGPTAAGLSALCLNLPMPAQARPWAV